MQNAKIFIDALGIVNRPTGLGKYSFHLLKSLFKNQSYSFVVLHQKNLISSHPIFDLKGKNTSFFPASIPVIGPKRELAMYNLRGVLNKCDIFHCLSSYLPAFGLNRPSIVTIHDLKYLFSIMHLKLFTTIG